MKDKVDFVLRAALLLNSEGMASPAQEYLPWSERETERLMGIALDLVSHAFCATEDSPQ